MSAQVEALVQSQKPEDQARAERWQDTLKRAGKLILLVIGPMATASALYQALIQEEVYPELKKRLSGLLSRTEDLVGPLEPTPLPSTQPPPTPRPAPTPDITPQPADVHTPEPSRTVESTWRGPLRFDWVTIPADWFLMGSDPHRDKDAQEDEQPQHRVYLPTFQIARVPVTVEQFAAFVRATDHRTTAEEAGREYTWFQPHGRGSQVGKDKAQHPVTCVSWDDAQAFCRWAKVRLPTEAEWEKAARGTDGQLFPWGDEPPDPEWCNFADSQIHDTTPVGSYPRGASPYGVLDMTDNVWEWCSSLWGSS
jgi:formylglycine-generating enzyme required for sulfatase activity